MTDESTFVDGASTYDPTEPVEAKKVLDEKQRARSFAAYLARPLLTTNGGVLAGKVAPDVNDLIRMATWILDGESEDLYPYTDTEGTIHLGPRVWMKPEGFLWVNGVLYEPSHEEGDD